MGSSHGLRASSPFRTLDSLAGSAITLTSMEVRIRLGVLVSLRAMSLPSLYVRTVANRVRRVLRTRSPDQVGDAVIGRIAIDVANLHTFRPFADKGFSDQLVNQGRALHVLLPVHQDHMMVSSPRHGMRGPDSFLDHQGPTTSSLDHPCDGADSPAVADFIHAFPTGNGFPFLVHGWALNREVVT